MSSSRSSFFGFEIAKTGLFINQHNLNVTGHNISNVNTPGYTRQRLVTSAIEPYSSIGLLAPLEHGLLGGGTRSHYVEQLRSEYLDRQFRNQNSIVSTWASRTQGLDFVQGLFREHNASGIFDMLMDQFSAALGDLQTDPTLKANRTGVVTSAQNLTTSFNQFYDQLVNRQTDNNEEIKDLVSQVNKYADDIKELNRLIYAFEINGEHANDLRDQRNLILDQLSSLVEVEVREYKDPNGGPNRLSVSIGSGASKGYLVDHVEANHLDTSTTAANYIQEDPTAANVSSHPLEKVCMITWATGYSHGTDLPATFPANPAGLGDLKDIVGNGQIYGLLTLRDGDSTDTKGIPYFVHQLDQLAQALATEFNKLHMQGYSSPNAENGNISDYGIKFFKDFGPAMNTVPGTPGYVAATDPGDPSYDPSLWDTYVASKVTAGNFQLDPAILKSAWNIACSNEKVTDTNQGNNLNVVDGMLKLFQKAQSSSVGNFGDFYRAFLTDIGNTAAFSIDQQQRNALMTENCDVQRMSISAVSIDEEMTNLIKFQHAYAASSRVITTMDEALEKLINGTGIVGR